MTQIVLVDNQDKFLGLKEKYAAHKLPVPLHRAISVLIYSKDKTKMLLQKRAASKPTWPDFWTNATCTHPLPNESYKHAAERRLKEEMGFTTPLTEILHFTYQANFDKEWGENEYDVTFEGVYDGEVKLNPDEASDYKWVKVEELYSNIKRNPDLYTPWFKIILKKLIV